MAIVDKACPAVIYILLPFAKAIVVKSSHALIDIQENVGFGHNLVDVNSEITAHLSMMTPRNSKR